MPRTRDCDFCGGAIEPGTGTMFVRKEGTTIYYCSAKCEKNADLGREARDLGWTDDETAKGETEATEPEPEESDPVEEDEETVSASDEAEDVGTDDHEETEEEETEAEA